MALPKGIRHVKDLPVEGKRVFVRVDLNVPLTKDKKVSDDSRITAVLPTIRHLIEREARIILGSHLGRPDGKVKPELSLEPVAARLAELLGIDVVLADEVVGDGARKVVGDLRGGQVALLENLRYDAREEANDDGFAKTLGGLPEGVAVSTALAGNKPFDVMVLFVVAQEDLVRRFAPSAKRLTPSGGLWIAWPKRAWYGIGLKTSMNLACARRSMPSLDSRAPSWSSSLQGLWNVPSSTDGRTASRMASNSRTQSVSTSSRQRVQASRWVVSRRRARAGVSSSGRVMPLAC